MNERQRRHEITTCGGDVTSLAVNGGELCAIVKFRNRGEMNVARVRLVRSGWRVITTGVVATATVKL